MNNYELKPARGQTQKSFYGKAIVEEVDGTQYLVSYDTVVMKREKGKYYRMWESKTPDFYGTYEPDEDAYLSATTLRHIKAFSGMNKKEYLALENAGMYDVLEWEE